MTTYFILFTDAMIHAIFADRKTKTRRVVNPQPTGETLDSYLDGAWMRKEFGGLILPKIKDLPMHCPYGKPGDRLIVKEASWMFCERRPNGTTKSGRPKWLYVPLRSAAIFYRADTATKPKIDVVHPETGNKWMWKYKSARFMPAWASRLTLEVTDIDVERVQDITEEDAKAEGAERGIYGRTDSEEYLRSIDCERDEIKASHKAGFRFLWNSINADRGYGWDANPWVWVVSFLRVK